MYEAETVWYMYIVCFCFIRFNNNVLNSYVYNKF